MHIKLKLQGDFFQWPVLYEDIKTSQSSCTFIADRKFRDKLSEAALTTVYILLCLKKCYFLPHCSFDHFPSLKSYFFRNQNAWGKTT